MGCVRKRGKSWNAQVRMSGWRSFTKTFTTKSNATEWVISFEKELRSKPIPEKDIKKFFNLKYFVIDCLRYKSHYSHFNLKEVLKLIKIIKPKKTILTNLNYEMDYSKLRRKLPKNVTPGYDGLSFYI